MGGTASVKSQIESICSEYGVTFSVDTFLELIIFCARILGTLDPINPEKDLINLEKPFDKLQELINRAVAVRSGGQIEKLHNVVGTSAILLHYLHTRLGELLFYKSFIKLMKEYIGNRDPHFSEEIKTEQAIFLSMVYEPRSWYMLLGKYEAVMQTRNARKKFEGKDFDLPTLAELRQFVKKYLKDECCHELEVIVRKGHKDRKSQAQLATRLLSWLNKKGSDLPRDEIRETEHSSLFDITVRYGTLFDRF